MIKQFLTKQSMSKTFLFILFLSLITRTILLSIVGFDTGSNSGEYRIIAENIVHYGSIVILDDWTGELRPYTYRMPGYSVYLSFFYTLLGITPVAHYAVAFSQVLMASLMAVFAAYMGMQIFSYRVGLLAGILFALDPWQSISTTHILNDTLYSFLYACSFLFALLAIKTPSVRWVILWALSLGLAVFVRPLPQYHIFLAIAILLITPIRFPRKLALVGITIFVFYSVVGGWMLRNQIQTGYRDLETNQGTSMLWRTGHLTQPPTKEEFTTNPQLAQAKEIAVNTNPPYGGAIFEALRGQMGISERDANELMVTMAWENALSQPVAYLKRAPLHLYGLQTGIGMLIEFSVLQLGLSDSLRDGLLTHLQKQEMGYLALNASLRLITTFIFGFLFLFGLAKAWFTYKQSLPFHFYFTMAWLYHFAIVILVIGQDRYRLTLHSVMWIYISYALLVLYENRNLLRKVK